MAGRPVLSEAVRLDEDKRNELTVPQVCALVSAFRFETSKKYWRELREEPASELESRSRSKNFWSNITTKETRSRLRTEAWAVLKKWRKNIRMLPKQANYLSKDEFKGIVEELKISHIVIRSRTDGNYKYFF
jgi:hypothetical protein